jgi:hypothetical protein
MLKCLREFLYLHLNTFNFDFEPCSMKMVTKTTWSPWKKITAITYCYISLYRITREINNVKTNNVRTQINAINVTRVNE